MNEEQRIAEQKVLEEQNKQTVIQAGGNAMNIVTSPVPANAIVVSEKTNYVSSQKGIIALGLYLILTVALSFGGLITLMMAERGDNTTANAAEKTAETPESNTNSAVNSNGTNTASAVNRSAGNNSSIINANAANGSAANTSNAANTDNTTNTNTTNTNTANTNTANANKPANVNATPKANLQQFPKTDVPPTLIISFYGKRTLSADSFLLLIVLFSGVLGAVIRGMFSFTKHLGIGDFSFKWTWFYLLLPFTGAALSMILYLVVRGGFYTSAYGEGLMLNLFSFAALGALTGLFTENAMEKLRQTAEVLLSDTTPKIPNAKEVLDQKRLDKK